MTSLSIYLSEGGAATMKDLNKKVQDIMETIKSIPLSKSTVNNYNSFFKEILKYCQERGLERFGYSSVSGFMSFQKERLEGGEINKRTYLSKRKPAWVLAGYTETGKIDPACSMFYGMLQLCLYCSSAA